MVQISVLIASKEATEYRDHMVDVTQAKCETIGYLEHQAHSDFLTMAATDVRSDLQISQ